MMMSTRSRRVKWHPTPPPPPTPKIINLPRRHTARRKKPRAAVNKQPVSAVNNYKGKLESLFGEEREFTRAPVGERRERVEDGDGGGGGGELAEEKWRFQAEILRAECNFLRMERKFALKKLERNRVQMERTLKSALQNLASGKKKIYEGKNMEVVLEEEMRELEEKLEELQSSFNGVQDHKNGKCKNFDKKASRLQYKLEKLGGLSDEKSNHEIREPIESTGETNKESSILGCKSQTKSTFQVEILKTKMDGLSKGMVDRMEAEYGSSTANSSASTSKRMDFSDHSSFSNQPKETMNGESNKCSGRCKVLVRKIVEQVRAETEQWSQMQEMLGQLRQEMEELQASRDFWEAQALASAHEIDSLHSSVREWREKANGFETKANELEAEVSSVKNEIEKLKRDRSKGFTSTLPLSKQLEREKKNVWTCRANKEPMSLGKQLAQEKRIMVCGSKENPRRKGHNVGTVRSPFEDIGNYSSTAAAAATALVRQNSNAIFPLHCPEPAKST